MNDTYGFKPYDLVVKLILLGLSSVSFHGTDSAGEGICGHVISDADQIALHFSLPHI